MRGSLHGVPKAITLGVLFLAFSAAASLAAPRAASADTVSISPSAGSYSVGQTFTVRVLASSPLRSVNALSGSVSFPANRLQVVSISKTDSIINLWVQDPTFSNVSGSFNFEGVVLNPGYMGSNGRVVSVTFRAIAEGPATISFASASMLANDGSGTNVLRVMQDGYLTVAPGASQAAPAPATVSPNAPKAPAIKSATHPDQEAWYSEQSAQFSWDVPAGVTGARLLYDKNADSAPTVLYDEPLASKRVDDLKDGEYWFHVQLRDSNGWGEVGHYRFRVDTTPPKAFKVTFPHGSVSQTPQPIIYFNTTDSVAGIDRYVVKVGEKTPLRVGPVVDSNPYTLPPQTPGKHTVLVEAYDRAGNYSAASAEFDIQSLERPIVTVYPETLEHQDIMKVRGTTYPNATVRLYIREDGEDYFTDLTKSNDLGDWGVVVSKKLDPGVYTFTVDVEDAAGAKSLETDPITFEVKSDLMGILAGSLVLYVGFGALALAALGAFAFALHHGYGTFLRARKGLQKDMDQMGKGIHKAFDLLRDDVNDHVRALERAKSRRDLTRQEEKMLAGLRESLDEAERFLEERFEDLKRDIKKEGKE